MKCVKKVVVDNTVANSVTYLDTSSAVLMSEQEFEPEGVMYTTHAMKDYEMKSNDVNFEVIGHVRTKSIQIPESVKRDLQHAYTHTASDRKYEENLGRQGSLRNDMELMGQVVTAAMFGDHVKLISDDGDISKTLSYLFHMNNYEYLSDNVEIYQMRE
ncbi:MAG: hypothetical protein GOV02_02555 [Candidatus Aenigmarchaeota archaeon]|nr:hypothetical protein [Candidatus Aenigmarchaeota archaeon]